jgi:hypothetical protein
MVQSSTARMWRLITKDFKFQWLAIVVLFVFEAASFVTFVVQFPESMRRTSGVFLQAIGAIGTFIISFRLLATEEASSSIFFLKGLPLLTREIFGAKYLIIWGYVILNALALNVGFELARRWGPWQLERPEAKLVVGGIVLQLIFASLLLWTATWVNSEKAIWIPFPLLLILLNFFSYAMSPSQQNSPVVTALGQIGEHWIAYALATTLALAALSYLAVWGLDHKRSLIS